MKIAPYNSVAMPEGDVVFKQNRWGSPVVPIAGVLFLATGILLMAGAREFGFSSVFLLSGCIILALMFRRWKIAVSPANWLLRFNDKQILIRIAPFFDTQTDKEFVAQIDRDDVEWIRPYVLRTLPQDPDSVTGETMQYLELKLRTDDLEPLKKTIVEASRQKDAAGQEHESFMPIRITEDGTVQLAWRGNVQDSYIAPSLRKAMRLLGSYFPVQPKVQDVADSMLYSAE